MNFDYLNQKFWGGDIPPENLLTPEPAGVKNPIKWNDGWRVLYFPEGQPYPSGENFSTLQEAQDWATWKAECYGVDLED